MTACDQTQTSLSQAISAVAHDAYRQRGAADITQQLRTTGCVVDVKSLFGEGAFAARNVWAL